MYGVSACVVCIVCAMSMLVEDEPLVWGEREREVVEGIEREN